MTPLDPGGWQVWRGSTGEQVSRDRYPLIRPIRYELSEPTGEEGIMTSHDRIAVVVNVSNGGLCLLLDWDPAFQEVLRLHVPMEGNLAQTPTLGEVRWVRPLPFEPARVYLVGLKFIL